MSIGGIIQRGNKKEAAAAPPAPTVTAANNGTSLSGTIVQLGATAIGANSPLLHNSFINTGVGFYLEVNGSLPFATAQGMFRVVNTAVGFNYAGNFLSTNGIGVHATGTTAVFGEGTITGVQGASTNGVATRGDDGGAGAGVVGTSIDGFGGSFGVTPASDSTIVEVVRLNRATSNPLALNGIGVSLGFYTQDTSGVGTQSNSISSWWVNATNAARTSQFLVSGIDSAVLKDLLALSGSGAARLNQYGIGTFTGVAAYTLQVDASGNIIEGAAAGGGWGTTGTVATLTGNAALELGGNVFAIEDAGNPYLYINNTTQATDLSAGDTALYAIAVAEINLTAPTAGDGQVFIYAQDNAGTGIVSTTHNSNNGFLMVSANNGLQINNGDGIILHFDGAPLTDGAGAAAGTITNAPTAGDPAKWLAIDDLGTIRYIPTWI